MEKRQRARSREKIKQEKGVVNNSRVTFQVCWSGEASLRWKEGRRGHMSSERRMFRAERPAAQRCFKSQKGRQLSFCTGRELPKGPAKHMRRSEGRGGAPSPIRGTAEPSLEMRVHYRCPGLPPTCHANDQRSPGALEPRLKLLSLAGSQMCSKRWTH